MSFNKGDQVVHGGHGLGEVVSLMEFEGDRFVRVAFPGDLKTMVPLNKAGQMLRRPMRKEQALSLLEDLKNSAPDPRHWRHRYRHATKILVEGSVRQRAALLGQFYALRAARSLTFAEKKIHDDAERCIRTELAFVLDKEADQLTKDLLRHFRKNPPEAKEPEDLEPTPADANVKFPKQEAPKIEGWRYLGTFNSTGRMRVGDRTWILNKKPKKRKLGLPDYVTIQVKKGNWHAYQCDVEGRESVYAVAAKTEMNVDAPEADNGKVWVEGGDLALIDDERSGLDEVAENLRWEMSPAGAAWPWGVLAYTAHGDGAYTLKTAGAKVVSHLRLTL